MLTLSLPRTLSQFLSKVSLRGLCTTMTTMTTSRPDGDRPKYQLRNGNDRLVWVDCEMTGLDVNTCHLLEVACLITDKDLNIVATGPELIIHQSDKILEDMNEWCIEHHGESGLTKAVKESKVGLQQAEMELLSFVRKHSPQGCCPLAGNSVHADKQFLVKYMPDFMKHLHYRIVDVSTVKELCKRWYPEIYEKSPKKKLSHRAMDDIRESIQELQFYRKTVFTK